ncbi:GTP pyrophosphokinase [Streptococcus pantholopis]|uniref:GTP pyrophosphokinase n=1 Tax=Streptococcus pantholopis TaxID=1811193 RepID=A0A172Q727_9STRE|nr:GTP pyrophosphokinase family protein [Streptococcus pantholopis]AND79303.1 GTP pyrophosphokinase [Streptococcus pantholopis]
MLGERSCFVVLEWEEFLDPYIQTVGELKIKLRGIRKQFRKQNRHSPIEFVTGRVKSVESIQEKMLLRSIKEENIAQDIQDIAGLRIMVQFVDDVDDVLDLLRQRHDMKIVQERDYIRNMKPSGYRSYHVVIEYPVDTIQGQKTVLAEIQIRTLAMNFWATIEHSLNYKYKGEFPQEIKQRLETTAKIAYELDEEVRKIREDIREAQLLFDPESRKLNDGVGNSDDTDEYYR